MSHTLSSEPVDVFVCVTCQQADGVRAGASFYQELETVVAGRGVAVRLHPVECLSVCKRPCTVAISAPNKWTYIVGDLDASGDMADLLKYIDIYAASEHGTPPLKERPAAIRRGTLARIPHFLSKEVL